MSPRSTLRVSGGHKSVQLDRLVRSERLRTIARLERVLPVQEAEDAYQDACVRALDRLSQQTSELGVRAWFHAILRRTVATHAEALHFAASRRQPAVELLAEPYRTEREAMCRCGARAMRRLRPAYRSVLQRAIADGKPIRDIAVTDQTSPNSARVRLHRARTALRASWSEVCGPCITANAGADCACSDERDGESR